jgi:lysophospholipase L1-like esterase
LLGDGVHPTARGYDVWWSAMEPVLKEMLVTLP